MSEIGELVFVLFPGTRGVFFTVILSELLGVLMCSKNYFYIVLMGTVCFVLIFI